VDPTAAVSPARIEQGIDDALSEESSGFRFQNRNPIFGNLLFNWDNLQHSWNDWVLNYDQRRQMNFLRDLQIGIEGWSDMVFTLVITMIAITALFWLAGWYRDRPPQPEAYEIQLTRLMKKLAKSGLRRRPAEDTRAFLQRAAQSDFRQHDQLAKIIDLYNLIKYGRQGASERSLDRLRSMVNSIRA
jgi:hypothetical protein